MLLATGSKCSSEQLSTGKLRGCLTHKYINTGQERMVQSWPSQKENMYFIDKYNLKDRNRV